MKSLIVVNLLLIGAAFFGCTDNDKKNKAESKNSRFLNEKIISSKKHIESGRRINYKEYVCFEDDKGYPGEFHISVYDFNDSIMAAATIFGKCYIILNTTDSFFVATFSKRGFSDAAFKTQHNLKKLLNTFESSRDFKTATCTPIGVLKSQRDSLWVSKYVKEYDHSGLVLRNADGYDCNIRIDCTINESVPKDSLKYKIDRILPPFVFYKWEQFNKFFCFLYEFDEKEDYVTRDNNINNDSLSDIQ